LNNQNKCAIIELYLLTGFGEITVACASTALAYPPGQAGTGAKVPFPAKL
jgi:hypothetical protein